jgi:hypothetical protein
MQIAVINRSTVWDDAMAQKVMAALQVQVDRDFAPIWDLTCQLVFSGAAVAPPAGAWWLTLLDTTDDATALGYHEITSDGMPLGKCFLKTTTTEGGIPSVVVSHELLEMLADPWVANLVLDNNENRPQRLYSLEVCDACEADEWGYQIGDVTVSDFVYPSWFESWRTGNPAGAPGNPVKFDQQGKISAPFQLLSGGYISYMNITGGGWQQATADLAHKPQYRAHVGTRRERRKLDKNFWRHAPSNLGA